MALKCDTYTRPVGVHIILNSNPPLCRRTWRLFAENPLGVNLGGAASSADLGGSSKYSNENFED